MTNVKSEGRKEVSYTFTDPDPDEAVKGTSSIKVEYEVNETIVKAERDRTPLVEIEGIKPEPESPTTRLSTNDRRAIDGDDSIEMDVKEGLETRIGEEGVLDILDQVDGTMEIGT